MALFLFGLKKPRSAGGRAGAPVSCHHRVCLQCGLEERNVVLV